MARLRSSSIAAMATAPKCSTTSRVAVLPPGISTWSTRSAKILPTYTVSEETVWKSCSATGHWLMQQPLDPSRMLGAVRSALRNLDRQPFGGFVIQRGADEPDKKRVWPGGPALQLRVRLGADEERVNLARVFDEFNQVPVGRGAGEPQPALGDLLAVFVVHLVPVPVPLRNLGGLVCLSHDGSRFQHGRIRTEPHRAAEVGFPRDGVALVGHRGDDGIGRFGVEFGRVGLGESHRTRRIDHDALQPQTQAEHRQPMRTGITDRTDLPFDAAYPESAGDQHAVDVTENRRRASVGLAVVGSHPTHFNLCVVLEAAGT